MGVDEGGITRGGAGATARRDAGKSRRRGRARGGRGGWAVLLVAWVVALGLLGLSACWISPGLAWEVDLAANLCAQWLVVSAAGAAVMGLLRCRRPAGVCVLAAMVGAAGLLWAGGGRGAVRPLEAIDQSHATEGLRVRFMHFNASTEGEGATIEEFMRGCRADVVSIVCPPDRQTARVVQGDGLTGEYAGKLVRPWRPDAGGIATDVTAGFVVSKWPVREFETGWLGESARHIIAGVVERPRERGGEFGVIAVHPRSPRSEARWRVGNAITEATGLLAARMNAAGLEVVVLADLNSTPTGYRSGLLASEAGLRRAKPLFALTGTYPSEWSPPRNGAGAGPGGGGGGGGRAWSLPAPWPASIAIDDAMVSRGVDVRGWEAGPFLSSDHRVVLVELEIPPPRSVSGGESGAAR